MSDAASALSAARPAGMAPSHSRANRLSPLEAMERGFVLFQSTFAREAWRYYAGTAPLVLCFIPLWVLDGQIRVSDGGLLLQAVLIALAYVLRVRMVASYMQHVRERAFGVRISKPAGAMARVATLGRLVAWKITLSAAALATLPTVAGAPWFYSGCQFASLEARADSTERESLLGCLAVASQWYGRSLLLFLMLFPLWAAVWLNGTILAIMVPQLLHSVFGVNTLLSTEMGIYSLIRSSAFWLSLFAGAWLAVDPIVKCTYVVVYQYLRSRREGDDLRGLLASLPRGQQKKAEMVAGAGARRSIRMGAAVGLLVIFMGVSRPASALAAGSQSSALTPTDSAQQERVQKLRQALDRESQREIYRWHDAEHPSPPTWFDKLLTKIGHAIKRGWEVLRDFIRKLWPRGLDLSPVTEKSHWQMKDLRLWLALIAAVTVAVGAVLFWLRRRREAAQLSIPITADSLPDLSDTAIANERSEDEWFALATRLEGEGELRLALRAAYLGLLAGLAQREWLTIRRDRTNREYLDEFTRRWKRSPRAAVEMRARIPEKLRGSLRVFDCVWYGSHAVTPATVAAYRQDQRELLNNV
jgi:hypothetical protein